MNLAALHTISSPSRPGNSGNGADGKVWCLNHEGLVAVVDAESGKLLASIPMGEPDEPEIRSSIAVAHGSLFIRTSTTLFCAGGG